MLSPLPCHFIDFQREAVASALPHRVASAALHTLSIVRVVLQMPIQIEESEGSFVR